MDKGLSVLVLRKYDLAEEADDGADICETVFEFHKDVSGGRNGGGESLVFDKEDKKELYRYFISVDNLHRDVCGEELRTCETIRRETKTSIKVAFRRVDDDVLYVFTCPLNVLSKIHKEEGGETSFQTLSESAFTILTSCGIGAGSGGSTGSSAFEAQDMPDAAGWLALFFDRHFASSSFVMPVFAYSSAHRNAEVRNVIVHHLLQSSCNPFFFTALDLQFTVFSRQMDNSLRVVYADDLDHVILPWLLCHANTSCFHKDEEQKEEKEPTTRSLSSSLVRIKAQMKCDVGKGSGNENGTERHAEEEACGLEDCFIKVCTTDSLCMCLKCSVHWQYFNQGE